MKTTHKTLRPDHQTIRTVEVGQTVSLPTNPPIDEVVKESCGASNGYWLCVTHRKSFRNQMEKDHHIGSDSGQKEHTLVWVCWEHGLEKP